mgnify:CR=1 FL=1
MKKLVAIFFCMIFQNISYAQQQCKSEALPASTPVENFEIQATVISDKTTGLMWQRCFVGLSGEDCKSGELALMSWPAALQYAEKLNSNGGFAGYRNWRVPNIKELVSIAEVQCVDPALNAALFPSAPGVRVWSSSPYNLYPHYSWFFDFKDFTTSNLERFKKFAVMLVRDIE